MGIFIQGRPLRTMAAVCAAAWLMAACGGGGGGEPAGPATTQAATVTLSGVASKGLMKQALIKVYAIQADGGVGAQIGQTQRTDGAGRYSVAGLPASTWVYVEVGGDSQTRMADEASGQDLALPTGFVLRAVQRLSSQGGDVLQVTPFSDMAVALALANGGLKPEVVEAANRKVVAFFNTQVLSTEPAFDQAGKPANAVALTLSALSALARDGGVPECAARPNQAEKVACVVAAMGQRGVSDEALVAKLEASRTTLLYGYTGAAVPGLVKQSPYLVTTAVSGGIAQAKALIANIRSNTGKDVVDSVMGRFDTVANELRQTASPLDQHTGDVLGLIGKQVAVLVAPEHEVGAVFSAKFGPELQHGRGRACTLFSDEAASQVAQSYAALKSVVCLIDVEAQSGSAVVSSGGATEYARRVRLLSIKVAETAQFGQYSVASRLWHQDMVVRNSGLPGAQDTVQWAPLLPEGAPREAMAALGEGSSDAVSYVFGLRGELMPLSSAVNAPDQLVVDLMLELANPAAGRFRLNAQGTLMSFKAGRPQAAIRVLEGSHAVATTFGDDDPSTPVDTGVKDTGLHLGVQVELASGARFTGRIDFDDGYSTDQVDQAVPARIELDGELLRGDGLVLFSGKVTLLAPADLIDQAGLRTVPPGSQLAFDGTLGIPGRPDMKVALTIKDDTAGPTFSGSYAQGSDVVLLEGVYEESRRRVARFKLSTPSNISISGTPDDDKWLILKGADVLGEIRGSSVDYADNTHERF